MAGCLSEKEEFLLLVEENEAMSCLSREMNVKVYLSKNA